MRKKINPEDLLKYEGRIKSFKTAAAGLAAAATLGSTQPAMAQQGSQIAPQSIESAQPQYSKDNILRSIAMIESSSGKNINHEQLPEKGIHHGETAYGSYGLTPLLVRETAKKHKDIQAQHPELHQMHGQQMHEYLNQNPYLEHDLASRHYDRLAQHFGHDPDKIAYAWLNGISGTHKAIKKGYKIDQHWHVQKVRKALQKIRGLK